MNIRKTAAVWAAVGAMALAVSCAGADGSGEVSENVSTESLSEEISESVSTESLSEEISESVSTESLSEVISEANEEMSDDPEDISEIFTYRIIDDYVRIGKYKGNDPIVVIPDFIEGLPVRAINENAFADCSITELTLPAEIEDVSAKSINYSKELQNIYISEGSENYISVDGVIYTSDGNILVMYPGGRTGAAEFAEGVTRIGDRAFYSCKIENVTLPDTVEVIGTSAFEKCSGLVDITIPGNVKTIGAFSFSGSGLENVTLSEGVKSIGTAAFERTEIMEIYLPDSASSVGEYILGSGERGASISACKPIEGLKSLEKYEKISYRNETVLDGAIRAARRTADRENEHYRYRGYLTDIDGDDFPELLVSCKHKNCEYDEEYPNYLYRYDMEKSNWEQIYVAVYDDEVLFYRDRESGEYMQLSWGCNSEVAYCFEAWISNENGEYRIGESSYFYPIGYYSENEGYIARFQGGGKYEIYEETSELEYPLYPEKAAFAKFIDGVVDKERYELLGKFSFSETMRELSEKYSDSEDGIIICGDFADSPDPEKAYFELGSRYDSYGNYIYPSSDQPCAASLSVTIGENNYNEYSFSAYLVGEDINPENFEKLAALPSLTSLHLFGTESSSVIDLTGIDKIPNLRDLGIGYIRVYDSQERVTVTNAECLKNTEILWLGVSGDIEELDFMVYLDKVRGIGIGRSMDRPDDFYSAVADMDSLEYIVESVWDINVTEGQHENIRKLRPDVRFCHYKV
ncbi:MAG: leucine-rich repeat domain-containing protein [Oscillospiraceae bacterium]|nr:leucine-rich repeat domain-containing protein [Oscillospiraceae bacterium]